jgi:hypothetical protein
LSIDVKAADFIEQDHGYAEQNKAARSSHFQHQSDEKVAAVVERSLRQPMNLPPAKPPDLGFKSQELLSVALKTEQRGEVA